MKTSLRLLAVTTVCSLSIASVSVSAQGTAFIYQGRLTEGGAAANGWYDFQCQLYNRATAGEPGDALVSTTVTSLAVPVTNGLFVLNLDFGAAPFNGEDRFLFLRIRTNNALNYTSLSPRERVAPTPYSILSVTAGALAAGSNQTFTGSVNFNPASGPPFTVGNENKVPSLNVDLLDGLDSSAFVSKAGDTMTGNLIIANPSSLSFGSTVRQMLNLWGTPGADYGIGIQAGTLYQRSQGGFAWYRGGIHADPTFDPGVGGTGLMTLNGNGNLAVTASSGVAVQGDASLAAFGVGVRGLSGGGLSVGVFGWATNGPLSAGVYGRTDGTNSVGVSGLATFTTGLNYGVSGQSASAGGIGVYGLNGGSSGSPVAAGVFGESVASQGNGVVGVANNGGSAYGVWGRSTSGYAGVFAGAVLLNSYSSSGSKPNLDIAEPSSSGFARLRMRTGGNPYWDIAVGTQPSVDATNSLRFFNSGAGNGDVMTLSPEGHLHVRVLTIEGGADLAEPFDMSESNLPKGSVVVIDPDHAGRLKLSAEAYDHRVAGVISGAGGVRPGIMLRQQDRVDGAEQVALTGRVYVLADAAHGAISPGDLLTTSDMPGHAMKVINRDRAQGAILGKAMTELKDGRGLVLVLVTLQ